MPDLLHRELLDRFGGGPCSCGRDHRLAVREVLIGEGALEASAEVLGRRHGSAPSLWVLSDENTEEAAAARWKSAVRASRLSSRVLAAEPRPVPALELAEALTAEVRDLGPDLVVGVGGGVVSDLAKKVSLEAGVPNWCVATAPSVDAYGSGTAAIRAAGFHRAVTARPSEVVVCDLGVLARAPPPLFLAGVGDLLAKFLACLDWNLGATVAGEHRCEVIAGFALGSARRAMEAARLRERNPLEAARALADAVLSSGFAMQALGSSRAAASAEHTIAHFWEAAGAAGAEPWNLHGIEVGAASRLVLRGYQRFYRRLPAMEPDVERRLVAFEREPPWEERLEEGMRPFAAAIAAEQRGGEPLDRTALARRLAAFRRGRERIGLAAEPLLGELSQAVDLLEGLGFPFGLDELGIGERERMLPVRNVRLLRRRYSTFDLAYELGEEAELLGAIAECAPLSPSAPARPSSSPGR